MSQILLEMPPLPYYITIGRTHYGPGEQHPNRRKIGLFDLLVVVRGTLSIGEEDKRWEVAEGQSLLLLPDRYHYATAPCRTETDFYWIHFTFDGSWREHAGGEHALPIRHVWANPYGLKLRQYATLRHYPRVLRLLEQLYDQAGTNGPAAYWDEQRRFMELLRCLEEEERGDAPPTSVMKVAARTEAYLRQHYAEDLTNEALAEALHFHPNYIVRCMKDIYRCTPMEYLQTIRLEQAKLLLVKTEFAVADIAERVGFRYAPYFSACFKKYAGLPPLAFRKRYSG